MKVQVVVMASVGPGSGKSTVMDIIKSALENKGFTITELTSHSTIAESISAERLM